MDYSVFTLPNGLKVAHSYMPGTAMVAVNVLYDVGARDEDPEHTGLAHLFEHLMFGGSQNVPDFDGELIAAGGTSNAWTSSDFTNFYDVLPAHNVETAFHIESDRMLALAFSERGLNTQKSVVIEEFKQTCLNQPYGDLSHHLMPMLYTAHPYRYPVIGKEPAHIEGITLPYIREFFYSHYAPDNAVLAVAGNVDLDSVRRLAMTWFAPIPARKPALRSLPQDPYPVETHTKIVYGRVPNTLIVSAVRMPGYGEPLYTEGDVITDLLANGKSARFNRNLVLGTDLFTMADACISGSEDSGWLMLQAVPSREDDETVMACVDALWAEARKLCEESAITSRDLQRVYNRVETDYMMSNMSYRKRAANLARAVMHGEEPDAELCRLRALTPANIASAAQVLLTAPPQTLLYRPQPEA